MNDIRLLVLDIDGTIAGESNSVSPRVLDAIAKVQTKGISVALATGRMYCSAQWFYHKVGSTLPLIAYNGAWIQHPISQDLLYHTPILPEMATLLLEELDQPEWRSQFELHCYCEDQLYVREISENTVKYTERSRIKANLVEDLRSLLSQPITKILVLSQAIEQLAKLHDHLTQRYSTEQLYLTRSTPIFLEATHPQVNKGSAVKYLTEKILGYQPEEIMVMGDNWNDVEMLEYGGIAVLMENSPQDLQTRFNTLPYSGARWIAPTVEEEGVAVAIERFLLGDG